MTAEVPLPHAVGLAQSSSSPRTTSFFDTTPVSSPVPAPRYAAQAPSPLSLSRSTSTRRRPVSVSYIVTAEPLSPLHQSPTASPLSSDSWKPPLPVCDDVDIRFEPTDAYFLGEGRYAQVYLASYRRDKGKCKETTPVVDEVNTEGDGLKGGSWRLCAAKRMNPDRESQTMGLREAFFLNRLKSSTRGLHVVKLLAVKEETEKRVSAHGRSVSDANSISSRPRSATDYLSTYSSFAQQQIAKGPAAISRLTLLLEHAPFGTLDHLLRTSPDLVGEAMWIKWAQQSSSALAWIHEKGVLHADIKPANLLVTASLDLRLSDFGSSLLIHPSAPPLDGVGLGTLPFSPPELVDPHRSFSFPVDIFALGATLYQCITGKEPYRGLRSIEMMHHVRRGGLWVYEEQERLQRIGDWDRGGSPYPSAWREDTGVKRGGSLRVAPQSRPRLLRTASAESLRASENIVDAPSPAGVKLWARWARDESKRDALNALLSEEGISPGRRRDSVASVERSEQPSRPDDGTMVYLDGRETVPERFRDTLRAMLSEEPEDRPVAVELCDVWYL